MELIKVGSKPSSKGPADCLTGDARRDPIFTAPAPSRLACGYVTFEAGAITEALDGVAVVWMEPVIEEQYLS